MSIGLVITTFNSEDYYKQLYDTIPFHKIDNIVTVNGGHLYNGDYNKTEWIQHDNIKYPSVARNDGLKYLMNKYDNDYYFVIEDDVLLKSENIFDEYIKASNVSGLQYFCFKSNAWDTGPIGARTPKLKVQFSEDSQVIEFYQHSCNEFTFRTKESLLNVGLYDESFRYMFDVDMIYRLSQAGLICFWNSPDLANSDELIMNNPNAVTRLNANGERDKQLSGDFTLFQNKHGVHVPFIPHLNEDEVVYKLKDIFKKYGK